MRVLAAALLMSTIVACGSGSPSSPSGDAELLTCIGPPFSPAVFDQVPNAEQGQSPEAAALRGAADSPEFPGKGAGWRQLGRSGGEVAFATGEPPVLDGYVLLRKEDGRWRHQQFGSGCVVRPYRSGRSLARWGLDPSGPPVNPASRSVALVVNDRDCASGVGPDQRLDEPTVELTAAAVIITFTSRPPTGDQDCQGHPPAKRVVELPEPLGDRQLRDGGLYPPQPPCHVEGNDCADDRADVEGNP